MLRTSEFRLGLLRKPQVIVYMSALDEFQLPANGEPLQSILTDRLKHDQALFPIFRRALHQTLVKQGCYSFEEVILLFSGQYAHRLSRFECVATDKHREPPEEALLPGIEQVITPLQRVAQGLLPPMHISRTLGQDSEAML